MIKKQLALTTSETTHNWLDVFDNNDILPQIIMLLSPVAIARLMLISCKALGEIPVLAPILMYQLEFRRPYHLQELLLYDSLGKPHPLKKKEISECESLLEKAHLDLLRGDKHLSSDKQRQFIRFYHLSSSPLSPLQNSDRATQLDNNIQSYINDNLDEENKALFDTLMKYTWCLMPANTAEKAITDMITKNPILVFATVTDGPWKSYTPLHVAASAGKLETVEVLLEAGADVNAAVTAGYYKGRTPLHWAAENGKEEIALLLLKAGAEVDATVPYGPFRGFTPLHFAAFNRHTGIVRILLDNGADMTATDEDGWTPLHGAASGELETVEALLEAGADPTVTDGDGETPLDVATNDSIKALLRKARAKT